MKPETYSPRSTTLQAIANARARTPNESVRDIDGDGDAEIVARKDCAAIFLSPSSPEGTDIGVLETALVKLKLLNTADNAFDANTQAALVTLMKRYGLEHPTGNVSLYVWRKLDDALLSLEQSGDPDGTHIQENSHTTHKTTSLKEALAGRSWCNSGIFAVDGFKPVMELLKSGSSLETLSAAKVYPSLHAVDTEAALARFHESKKRVQIAMASVGAILGVEPNGFDCFYTGSRTTFDAKFGKRSMAMVRTLKESLGLSVNDAIDKEFIVALDVVLHAYHLKQAMRDGASRPCAPVHSEVQKLFETPARRLSSSEKSKKYAYIVSDHRGANGLVEAYVVDKNKYAAWHKDMTQPAPEGLIVDRYIVSTGERDPGEEQSPTPAIPWSQGQTFSKLRINFPYAPSDGSNGEMATIGGAMGFMKMYFQSTNAVHETPAESLLGNPDSHGCVRNSGPNSHHAFFNYLDKGVRVAVLKDAESARILEQVADAQSIGAREQGVGLEHSAFFYGDDFQWAGAERYYPRSIQNPETKGWSTIKLPYVRRRDTFVQ